MRTTQSIQLFWHTVIIWLFLLLTVVMQRVGPLDRLAKMLASETAWYSTVIYPQICGYKIKCEIWISQSRSYSSICRSYRVVKGLEGFCWKWKESFLLQVSSLQKRLAYVGDVVAKHLSLCDITNNWFPEWLWKAVANETTERWTFLISGEFTDKLEMCFVWKHWSSQLCIKGDL